MPPLTYEHPVQRPRPRLPPFPGLPHSSARGRVPPVSRGAPTQCPDLRPEKQPTTTVPGSAIARENHGTTFIPGLGMPFPLTAPPRASPMLSVAVTLSPVPPVMGPASAESNVTMVESFVRSVIGAPTPLHEAPLHPTGLNHLDAVRQSDLPCSENDG